MFSGLQILMTIVNMLSLLRRRICVGDKKREREVKRGFNSVYTVTNLKFAVIFYFRSCCVFLK